MFVGQHLPDSRIFAWLRQIPCNHQFLGGIIQIRDVMSWWGPHPFQVNSFKNCKNWVWKLVSKRQVESVKESVTSYIVPRTTSESHVIENALLNTDIARKADSGMVMNSQSYCYEILHFVLGSHLIVQRNMHCLCLFVVLKSTDV